MALEPVTAPSAPAARGDAFVAERLTSAEQRIRLLDLAAAGLGFLTGTCVYAAIIIGIDRLFPQADLARQLLFLGYLFCAATYIGIFIVRPLTLRINPYFAARQVERTLPGAKNSLVNWIDLHGQPLPPAIRNALGLKAAKDLARVDIEQAVSGRRAGIAGGIAAAACGLLLAMLLSVGGGPFFDGLTHAFAPFRFSGPARTRTRIAIVAPEAGDATVSVGHGVAVKVEVSGKVPDTKGPDAVCLLYRYGEDEPWLRRPMIEESESQFSTSITATEVRSGFWYRVTGGDAETAVYRVSVCATPQITDFQATYHFPAYAAAPKQTRRERILRAVAGTEVVLWTLTNRTVRAAHVDFEDKTGRTTYPGQIVAGDAQAFQVRMPLKQPGLYRIGFTSVEGETFSESLHPVQVLADLAPEVELTKPAADVTLPANGLLPLVGQAADEFGVRELTLRLKEGERTLKARPYRSPDALRLPGGGYPLQVSYKDSLDLATLRADDVGPFQPAAGMEIEYWLEAADACEPKPNVGASKHYRVKLTEPQKDSEKQKEEREQAKKDQKQHEQKQDEQLKQEAEDRQEKSKEADQKENDPGRQQPKDGNGGKGDSGQSSDRKENNSTDNSGRSDSKNDSGNNNSGTGNSQQQGSGDSKDNSNPQQAKTDQANRDNARRLKDVLQKKGKGSDGSPENKESGKPDNGPPGDNNKSEKNPDSAPNGADKDNGANNKENGADKKPSNPKQAGAGDPKNANDAGKPDGNKVPNQPDKSANGNDKATGNPGQSGSKPDDGTGRKQDNATDPGKGDQSMSKPGDGKNSDKPDSGKNGSPQQTPATDGGDRSKQPDASKGPEQPSAGKPEQGNDATKQPPGDKPRQDGTRGDKAEPRKPAESNNKKGSANQAERSDSGTNKKPESGEAKPQDGSRPNAVKEPSPEAGDDKKEHGDNRKGQSKDGGKNDSGNDKSMPMNSADPGRSKDKADKPGEHNTDAGSKPDKNATAPEKRPASEGGADKKASGPQRADEKNADKNGAKKKDGSGNSGSKDGAVPKKADADKADAAKNATPDDAKKTAEGLQSKDPDQRADAAKKLEEMSKDAANPQTRDEARKALEQNKSASQQNKDGMRQDDKGAVQKKDSTEKEKNAGKADGKSDDSRQNGSAKGDKKPSGADKAGQDKNGNPEKKDANTEKNAGKQPMDNGSPSAKNDKSDPGQKSAGERKTDPKSSQPGGDDAPKDGAGDRKDPATDPGKKPGASSGPSKEGPDGKWDPDSAKQKNTTGEPGDKPGNGNPENTPRDAKEDPASPPELPKSDRKNRGDNRSTELQLEDLKNVTKKDLEAANLSEEDLANLRQWLAKQKAKGAPPADPKDGAVPPQHGASGTSYSAGRVQPATGGKTGNLSRGNRAPPPPGYQEATEALKRMLNKAESDSPR